MLEVGFVRNSIYYDQCQTVNLYSNIIVHSTLSGSTCEVVTYVVKYYVNVEMLISEGKLFTGQIVLI